MKRLKCIHLELWLLGTKLLYIVNFLPCIECSLAKSNMYFALNWIISGNETGFKLTGKKKVLFSTNYRKQSIVWWPSPNLIHFKFCMVCSFLIIMFPAYDGQYHSPCRLRISTFIDINASSILQEVVAVGYLQQCVVLTVFQTRISSWAICIVTIRFTHTAMHDILCTDNLQVQCDCEQKMTSCSQDERFARERFAVLGRWVKNCLAPHFIPSHWQPLWLYSSGSWVWRYGWLHNALQKQSLQCLLVMGDWVVLWHSAGTISPVWYLPARNLTV